MIPVGFPRIRIVRIILLVRKFLLFGPCLCFTIVAVGYISPTTILPCGLVTVFVFRWVGSIGRQRTASSAKGCHRLVSHNGEAYRVEELLWQWEKYAEETKKKCRRLGPKREVWIQQRATIGNSIRTQRNYSNLLNPQRQDNNAKNGFEWFRTAAVGPLLQ